MILPVRQTGRMNDHRKLTLIGLIVGAVLLAILAIVDPFPLLVLGLGSLLWLALPVGVFTTILLVLAICKQRSRRIPIVILTGVLVFAALVGLAIPLNRVVHDRGVVAAKAYPEQVEPMLEAYRSQHGRYPERLDQIPAAPRMPWLLRRFGYHSDGSKYWFTFPQPGGLIDVWDYISETHKWHLST